MRKRDRIYRDIWEKAYGPIPKDERGISFDIHHIDGDPTNNALENLKAVSVADHYDIHYKQEDWHQASLIAKRLFISLDEWKALRSKAAKAQWEKLSEEEKSSIANKAMETKYKRGFTRENFADNMAKGRAAMSHEARSENSRKGWATRKQRELESKSGN
jgi:hypothetical protein